MNLPHGMVIINISHLYIQAKYIKHIDICISLTF